LPTVNSILRPKLLAELRPGARIVSHAFDLDFWRTEKEIPVYGSHSRHLYLWIVPKTPGELSQNRAWQIREAMGETHETAEPWQTRLQKLEAYRNEVLSRTNQIAES